MDGCPGTDPCVKRSFSRKRKRGVRTERSERAPWWPPQFDRRHRLADRWPIYALTLAAWLLSLPLFEPYSWWPFGFVALAPWTIAVCASRRTIHVYLASLMLGAAYFLTHLNWLDYCTLEGYVAASIYLGSYFLLASWLLRHLYRRRGLKAVIALPLVWTAVEWVRSHGPLGFPWFLLGHSQIQLPTMIQIADLAGAYGVTFVLAAVSGWLADLAMAWFAMRRSPKEPLPTPVWRGAGIALVLVAATVFYGRYRLATQELVEGPKVAVVQGDFLLEANFDAPGVPDNEKAATYMALVDRALRSGADLIVLPETPWMMYLNSHARSYRPRPYRPPSEKYHEDFHRRVDPTGTYLVVGAMAEVPQPPGAYPSAHRYNSAYVYTPRVAEPDRYNKIHLVPFGEYVPFRYTKSLFWLYRWLNDSDFNPWGRGGNEYSLTAGTEYTVFPMRAHGGGREYRFGVTICYEDVIPYVFRRFVGGDDGTKRVDFMLNISNDGWFGHSAQQPQHLANCAFRAVENRVPIARAVNTGVSGFIRPDGTWYDVVSDSQTHPRAGGTETRTAALMLDSRVSFYSLHGDVFAMLCGLVAAGAAADAGWRRFRGRKRAATGRM
jgi:apolipoprotein N-acyltransferase